MGVSSAGRGTRPVVFNGRRICAEVDAMTNGDAAQDSAELPESGVLMGFDYGTKRIGVAVSDRDQKFSSPVHNHQRQGLQGDERFFRKLVAEYCPVGLVIGLPIHLSGDESEKSREARRFAQWLSKVTDLPFGFQDERFTSFHAERMLTEAAMTKKQRRDRMDKLAAQILLQNFLERRMSERKKRQPPEAGSFSE